MREAGGADFAAVGFVGPVRHQIDAELALGGLDRDIDLARRHMEPFGIKLEVVDQALHRRLHVRARGRRDLAPGQNVTRTVAQLGNGLFDNAHRLAHLFHAAEVAVIAVAVLAHRDLEVEFVIAFIGLRAAQVPGEARSAHHNPRKGIVLNVVFSHHANIGVALFKDAVFGQKPVNIVQHGGEFMGPLFDVVDQIVGQVLMHATGPEIGCVQARTAGPFIENHQLFTLFKAPQRRGQCAHIKGLRGHVQNVVQNPANLAKEHPDQGRTAGHFDARQLFDGQTPSMFLVHRRHVIEPVKVRQVLQIRPAFHQLFGATVQETNMRVTAFHNLAVQFKDKAQNPVRRRVLRAEVDVEVADFLFACEGVFETFGAVHHWFSPITHAKR
mmetsp:Transcript_18312/g.29274  ORF Transcript_18312/g.29274 Transcript_18312/m.29274 type:complete len:384 (-) Transcript_18312:3287-4438(-)